MELLVSSNCISCGLCSEVCPASVIDMEMGKPILSGKNCIKCGHCEAICPKHALTNNALNHESIIEITQHPVLNHETAELFLRSRRSIRCFKEEIVTKEETEKTTALPEEVKRTFLNKALRTVGAVVTGPIGIGKMAYDMRQDSKTSNRMKSAKEQRLIKLEDENQASGVNRF